MAVTQGETSLTVNSGAALAVCLLQLATSTAYDDDGNVTATIDAMGRVTAWYLDASDNDVAGYQGQVLGVDDRRGGAQQRHPRQPTGLQRLRLLGHGRIDGHRLHRPL